MRCKSKERNGIPTKSEVQTELEHLSVGEDIPPRVVGDENTDNQTFMNDVHPEIRFQVTFRYADDREHDIHTEIR